MEQVTVPEGKKVTRFLDPRAFPEGPVGNYEVVMQKFYDTLAIDAAMVGRNVMFQNRMANFNYQVTNLNWDGGEPLSNQGLRIEGIGCYPEAAAGILSSVDSWLIEDGVYVSIEVVDNADPVKMEAVPAHHIIAGGGMAFDTAAAVAGKGFGTSGPGVMMAIDPPIDVDPQELLTIVAWVPIALATISATADFRVIISCLQIKNLTGFN